MHALRQKASYFSLRQYQRLISRPSSGFCFFLGIFLRGMG
ncbi:hypothetical protein NBRC111894_4150 [Sporolactobacillus inulinus]|uniref:Uncharacterized protein n=1 Tax=Sporolactobacillus inulinus TaxID=2078 RepID=A0A4Y1ZHB0_9BACL|nr:hypothetical protein NBRC111894_4150 [Sporolactobacillus inulinus]